MAEVVQKNPNAATSVGSGGIGVLVVWLLNRYANAGLTPEEATGVGAAVTAIVLFVGRSGLRGILRTVWDGNSSS